MRKGHYRYIRKSSLGAYKFSDKGTTSSKIRGKNAQYNLEIGIANMIPDTLIRRRAIALIDEIEIINNSDWKFYGKPSTYTRDKICYKINIGIYDELLSKEGIFEDWENLIYTLYKSEEKCSLIKSTGTWDKTMHMINEVKRKGNLTNQEEVELMEQRINKKVEYYNEKYKSSEFIYKLFLGGIIIVIIFYAVGAILN